tara:strand:+ start:8618 stop:9274 length:657 start_codon:yes stop_codon:yes gene_type:complete
MKIQVWLWGVCALVFLGCGVPEDEPDIGSVGQAVGETCGDSIVGPAETCDDGNATAGDGCSDTCIIEAGHVCRTPGSTCRTTVCSVDAVGGETFAQMNFIEIGVGDGAYWGTTGNSPAGYHARPSTGATNPAILGYVADPSDTDWTDYDGDFFVPGSPEEGWGLEVGGATFNNNRSGPTIDMAGTFGAWATGALSAPTYCFRCFASATATAKLAAGAT